MPSGSQIRAARGLLGWSASELAERSDVTLRTIQRFETAEGVPPNRSGSTRSGPPSRLRASSFSATRKIAPACAYAGKYGPSISVSDILLGETFPCSL